jgi:hypothetical protein
MQNPGIGSSSQSGIVSTKTPLTASTPTNASVTTSSSLVVSANANRKGLVIVNLSSNTISFGIGASPAILNSGITLTGLGSVWNMSEYDYNTSDINAIGSASSTISIQEFV